MVSNNVDIVRAYRRLYKSGLRAVQYSKPARYVLRDSLRKAFRNGKLNEFDCRKVENTVTFLDNASKDKGIEHKVVKNLLFVRFWQQKMVYQSKGQPTTAHGYAIRNRGYEYFDDVLEKMNQSLNMCLR